MGQLYPSIDFSKANIFIIFNDRFLVRIKYDHETNRSRYHIFNASNLVETFGEFIIDWSTYSYTSDYQKRSILYGDEVYILWWLIRLRKRMTTCLFYYQQISLSWSREVCIMVYHDFNNRIFLTSLIFF